MAISKTLHNTLKQYGKISHEFSGELYDNMDNFSFKDVTGYAKNNAKSVGRAATKTARATYEAAKGVYNDLREDGVISDELHGNLKAVKDKAEDFVKTGIEDGKETVEMVGKLAKRQANKVYTTLREVPANLYSGAKEGAQTVYTTARELPSDLYEGVKGRAKQA